jgi:hypothetical protein
MPEARLAFAPFAAQVAFFRRKVNVPSARGHDLQRADHAHGFMVAGLARADVLEDLRRAIDDAIARGETLADFGARFEDIVRGRWEGWTGSGSEAGRAWRTRIIYQTNLRTSYMAGRWEQLREFPYLKYQHNTVENPRHEHQAWDGRIIAADEPWWDTHYPPNGWGCRCTVTGVSAQRLRALRGDAGADGPPSASAGDPPPEWAYHVGKAARSLPAAAKFGEKLMALPPVWREIALADAQQRQIEWFVDWPGFVRQLAQDTAQGVARTRGTATPIGFVASDLVERLGSGRSLNDRLFTPIVLETALIAAMDRTLAHALRREKWAGRMDVRAALVVVLENLPQWIARAPLVVLDISRGDAVLLFATPVPGGQYDVVVCRADQFERRAEQPARAVWLVTVERRPAESFTGMRVLRRLP